MRKILLVLAFSATLLGGCTGGNDDATSMALLDDRCADASTGDQYRYCLEVGPEEAFKTP